MSDPIPLAERRHVEGYTSALDRVAASIEVVLNKTAAMASGLAGASGGMEQLADFNYRNKTAVPEAGEADQIPWYEEAANIETGGLIRSLIGAQKLAGQGLVKSDNDAAGSGEIIKKIQQASFENIHQDLPGAVAGQAVADQELAGAKAHEGGGEGKKLRDEISELKGKLTVMDEGQKVLTPWQIAKNNPEADNARDFKNEPAKQSSASKPEYAAFEKMGFVMGGGSNPLLDATKRQTDATQQLTAAINRIAQSLNPGGTGAATVNAI